MNSPVALMGIPGHQLEKTALFPILLILAQEREMAIFEYAKKFVPGDLFKTLFGRAEIDAQNLRASHYARPAAARLRPGANLIMIDSYLRLLRHTVFPDRASCAGEVPANGSSKPEVR